MAMRQVCPSLSAKGAHKRAVQRQQDALNRALLASANPEADYWYNELDKQAARLLALLPEYIAVGELQDDLLIWINQSNGMTIAKGYKAGADYLEACARPGACAADRNVLLRQIRGKLYHAANVDLTEAAHGQP